MIARVVVVHKLSFSARRAPSFAPTRWLFTRAYVCVVVWLLVAVFALCLCQCVYSEERIYSNDLLRLLCHAFYCGILGVFVQHKECRSDFTRIGIGNKLFKIQKD